MLKHMRDIKPETSWEEAAELCKGEPEWADVSSVCNVRGCPDVGGGWLCKGARVGRCGWDEELIGRSAWRCVSILSVDGCMWKEAAELCKGEAAGATLFKALWSHGYRTWSCAAGGQR